MKFSFNRLAESFFLTLFFIMLCGMFHLLKTGLVTLFSDNPGVLGTLLFLIVWSIAYWVNGD